MGGRGASAFESGKRKALRDYSNTRKGKVRPLDATKYGAMLQAENVIRNLKREQALIYEAIERSPLAAFQGNENSVGFDANIARGRSITHNHPGKYGGTFSPADVSSATALGTRRMRAATREGNYYLNPTKKANPSGLQAALAKAAPKLERRMNVRYNQVQLKVSQGKMTLAKANNMSRTYSTGVYDLWYKQNAEKFGYVYGKQKIKQVR